MKCEFRQLMFVVFPIIGGMAAWMFRPSERDVYTLEPVQTVEPLRATVALPDGNALRFIGIPDPSGGPAFYLLETEVPAAIWRSFSDTPPTYEDAAAFCKWLEQKTGIPFRLPTQGEWQLAAQGGLPNAEYAWGYGTNRPESLFFDLDQAPQTTGPALGYGFKDMAGGRWEWTQEGTLMGSAWSETNPHTLALSHVWTPPAGYRGYDVGLRILMPSGL